MTIGGFFIPAKEVMVFNNLSFAKDEDTFPQPATFDPYRWTQQEDEEEVSYTKGHAPSSLPFSEGMRSCVGLQMLSLEQGSVSNIS